MPKVSVILPVYNCAGYLTDSISSVLDQTFADLELLVIDDGSTDNAADMIKEAFRDPRLIYVRQNHGGLSSARNRGLDLANGEYAAFIDGDDIFVKDKLARQLALFEHRKNAGIAYTSERYFFDGDKDTLFDTPHAKLSGDVLYFLKRSNFVHVSTVMLKLSLTVGGIRFDTGLKSHEDWDFFLKLAERGEDFFYLDEALSLIRVRPTSMTAAGSVMDSSRAIVGGRAKEIWRGLKDGMNIWNEEGRRLLFRYISSKVRAKLLDFPNAPRFNAPSFFKTAPNAG